MPIDPLSIELLGSLMDGGTLSDTLAQIKTFMDANPNEVRSINIIARSMQGSLSTVILFSSAGTGTASFIFIPRLSLCLSLSHTVNLLRMPFRHRTDVFRHPLFLKTNPGIPTTLSNPYIQVITILWENAANLKPAQFQVKHNNEKPSCTPKIHQPSFISIFRHIIKHKPQTPTPPQGISPRNVSAHSFINTYFARKKKS
jgi:hypothetical protein